MNKIIKLRDTVEGEVKKRDDPPQEGMDAGHVLALSAAILFIGRRVRRLFGGVGADMGDGSDAVGMDGNDLIG